MNLKKTILFQVLKKGLLTPTLPDHIIEFQNKLYIRIIRVLGSLSLVLLLSHRLELYFTGVYYSIAIYICFIFILMFNIYIIYINYHRIIHSIKVLRSDKLDIH